MARAANSPIFGPSAKVLKQSASNFFSDDVISGRYGPLQSARQKFLFFAKFHNLTTNIFSCCSLHFTVLPTFRFTCFHANQWAMSHVRNQSKQPTFSFIVCHRGLGLGQVFPSFLRPCTHSGFRYMSVFP